MISDGNTWEVFRRAHLLIGIVLVAFAVIMVVGMLGYKQLGGADTGWLDALYMTFLMVATIDYGAGVEIWQRPEAQIFMSQRACRSWGGCRRGGGVNRSTGRATGRATACPLLELPLRNSIVRFPTCRFPSRIFR